MSFIVMIIFTMVASDLLWWFWADRLLRRRQHSRLWRSLLAVFMAAQFACLVIILGGRMSGYRPDPWISQPVLSAVFIWHFILLPVALVVGLLDAIAATAVSAWRWIRQARREVAPLRDAAEAPTSALSRRDFLRTTVAAAPPVATLLATGASLWQMNEFRVRPIHLTLGQLPAALDGLTIAHVSDIHVGRFTTGRVLRRIVEATNDLKSDLVLLTGDLINHALADLPAGIDAVKRMEARYGAFMCEGNHDLMENRIGFERGVKQSGIPLLINESQVMGIRGHDVQLLGLRWGLYRGARGDDAIGQAMRSLLEQRRPDAFPILLAHHPHAFEPAADAGIPLTLAGHTHGGQIMASPNVGFGPMMFRYWSGLYTRKDSSVVVSNGVGNWFPLRINAPAEIIHITLHRG